ncbi:hypothetical protein ACYOEI_03880 [Singulisphaera rosea]
MSSRPETFDRYVGPETIRSRSVMAAGGTTISSQDDLRVWLEGQGVSGSVGQVAATFVIDPERSLRIADRRSEHVACASEGLVLAAGEMFISSGKTIVVEDVSNLSTRYCPEPESWPVVGEALDELGIPHPGRFTTAIVFRRGPTCAEWNVVKDVWFVCQVCGGELPRVWNFGDVPNTQSMTPTETVEVPYQQTIAKVRETLLAVFAEVDGWFTWSRPRKPRPARSGRSCGDRSWNAMRSWIGSGVARVRSIGCGCWSTTPVDSTSTKWLMSLALHARRHLSQLAANEVAWRLDHDRKS